MAYLPDKQGNFVGFEYDALKGMGLDFTEQYAQADPFPHVVIDNFLPERVIDLCLSQFPQNPGPDGRVFERAQERYKTNFHPDYLDPDVRALFYAFNARPFTQLIENITGIKQLIPDPHFLGGGFHEIKNGGHLSVHADFNYHKPLNLERKVNVLIYLNRDWKDEYGGQLELWRADMSECVQSITPIANRCAIFTTNQYSMHGNPAAVSHPGGISRKSIALYYYTATWHDAKQAKTTQFRSRAGSKDRIDWPVRCYELFKEVTPPFVMRNALRMIHKLSQ